MLKKAALLAAAPMLFLSACAGPLEGPATEGGRADSIVAGAAYTTFDAVQGGCKDSPNGVDCNNYVSKADVYLSGGPGPGGLSDGDYYFAILTPGSQSGGFVDGASGNLSDTTAGGTAGDTGSGDDASNRTFTVTGHAVSFYGGTHATGTAPNGHSIIQALPYDDTSNAGGVYILAVCQVGATSPSQCKYDAFRVKVSNPGDPEVKFPVVAGGKYYDANANGTWDTGEVGIEGWPIDFVDEVSGTVATGAGGTFSVTMLADTYTFSERLASSPWMQTGNLVSQASTTGSASATLANKTYSVTVADDSTVDGIYFGNLCIGAGGGLTLGFWSNKNGAALVSAADLGMLVALSLRNADGSNYDPPSYKSLRSWLLSATATNMAYMLSAQLTAMELNVFNGFVSATALVYAPGAATANANGFATVGDLMAEANSALAANGLTVAQDANRSYQEALKNALDNGNNNRNFVQAGPASCPAPLFP